MKIDTDSARSRLRALATERAYALGRLDEATTTLRDAACEAMDETALSESEVARLAGVSRPTIRAWRGK